MRHGLTDGDEIVGRHLDWRLYLRFLAALRPYRRAALGALGLLPLLAAAKLVQPWLLKEAIDRHILPGDLTGLPLLGGLFLLVVAFEGGLVFLQSYLVQAVGQRVMADFRRDAFGRLLRLPVAFFDRHPSGRLVTRLTSDVENVGELFGAGVVSALGDLVTLAGIVAVMVWIDPRLSLIAFAVVPPLLLMGALFRRHMRLGMRQVRARLAGLNAYIAERLGGVAEVRLFGQEQRTLEEFEELQQEYCDSTLKVINWDASFFAVVEALGAVAVAAVLWQGGGGVIAGAASFGTLVAFVEYVQKFFAPLRDLSSKYSVLQSSNASLERIFDLLDQPEEEGGSGGLPQGGAGTVRFEGVRFSYDGRTPVLSGIDLTVAPGETVALVGETGSGKTTLARLLLAFYRPAGGRVLLDGRDLADLDPAEVRRRVGWVSQEPLLFAGTVRENVDPQGRLDDGELRELLARCGALGAVERLGGPEATLSERGKNLAAGERQLLCLARALAARPAVLVLDEATSRLDPLTEETVERGLAAAGREASVLLIAHRLRGAQRADRIVVLRRGEVCESGTHAGLLAAGGLYARLWRLQALGVDGEEGTVP
jgi:ATP-binding cassette subfamily B protein